jgi:hypothetical protein
MEGEPRDGARRVLHPLIGKWDQPTIRMERLKLLANGCQVLALGRAGAGLIAPAFNRTLHPSLLSVFIGCILIMCFEVLAVVLLGYIPLDREEG